jgi:hypothetical protein
MSQPSIAGPHAVLSFLCTRPVEGLLDNHRGYARQHGYEHVTVDATHVWGPRQPTLFRYHAIYHQLLQRPAGAWLLVLDSFAAIYWPHTLQAAFGAHESVVVAQANDDRIANPSMLALRNTPAVREQMRRLTLRVGEWACYVGADPDQPEGMLVAECFKPLPCPQALESGVLPNVQSIWPGAMYAPELHRVRPLAANAAPAWTQRDDGRWTPAADFDFRAVLNLVEEARDLHAGRTPAFLALAQEVPTAEPELHLNSGAPIGFISHYTANVAGYGRIHEHNFARWCRRHGYGYHLYRAIPDFLPPGIRGSWAKAHLVRQHFGEHDFVCWIDADVLAVNQSLGIESWVEGREAYAAMDHTAWTLNSSLVGLRDTPAMRALLDEVCARIEALEDRSSTHASGGDQTFFARSFDERGLIDAACVVGSLGGATSPIYATRDSMLVHFPAQYNDHRAATMAAWERWSLDNDAREAAGG